MEPELHFGEDVLVPELAGWRREHLARLPETAYLTTPPDWLCEVASPSTVRHDRVRKMPLYAANGVRHIWRVHPDVRLLEVYRLEGASWIHVAAYGGEEALRAEPFEAVALDMAEWWAADEPDEKTA